MTALVLLVLCADPQLEPPPMVPAVPNAQAMPPPPPPPPPPDSGYEPPPPPSEPRTKRLWPISVAGGATLLATWIGSIIGQLGSISCHGGFLSGINCSSESWWLWVPVLGPWFALSSSNTSDNGRPWVVLSGILQVSGLAGIIVGLVVRVPDTSVEVGPFKVRPSLNGFAAAFD